MSILGTKMAKNKLVKVPLSCLRDVIKYGHGFMTDDIGNVVKVDKEDILLRKSDADSIIKKVKDGN